MEDQAPKNNKMMIIIPIVIAAVVILGVAGVFAYQKMNDQVGDQMAAEPTPEAKISEVPATSEYKDGTYKAVGNYVSPGGPREVNLTLTLKDGVVTDSVFQGLATDPTSKRFQGEFTEGYKPMVVGKNIDAIAITKVSGSSLTPKGFTDALEKIKVEAKEA